MKPYFKVMKFGICLLSIVPVRSEPSEKAEMVTQLVFGDLLAVEDMQDEWMSIRIIFDNYEGWVNSKQIMELSKEEFSRLNNSNPRYITDVVEVVQDETKNSLIPVVLGSAIYGGKEKHFHIGVHTFSFDGSLSVEDKLIDPASLLETAMLFINAPYLWGGKTPFGVDCSGYTQTVFKLNNIKLLRDASQQASQGETVGFIGEAHAGDLIFFDNEEGKIVHVGIYMGENKIIHASGKVRIDAIDHQGIYNNELKKYTHTLRLIQRIL